MLPTTEHLAKTIRYAVLDELKHRGVNKHEALLAVVDLVDDKDALREVMHGGLDDYCKYLKVMKK